MSKKRKKKKKKVRSMDEFRKLHDCERKGHPTYIYARVGDEFNFIGITHSPITKRKRNIKLDNNPEPKNSKPAYLRSYTDKHKKDSFSKPLDGWKFSQNDYKKAKSIIEENSKSKKQQKKKGR